MDLSEARKLARELMDTHKLTGWSLAIDDSRTRFGHCNNVKQRITLSAPLILLNDQATVKDTILHEIAHALTPYSGRRYRQSYHGRLWKLTAQSIGARPEACYSSARVVTPAAPWQAVCPVCQRIIKRHRMSKALLTQPHYCTCHRNQTPENELRWERV